MSPVTPLIISINPIWHKQFVLVPFWIMSENDKTCYRSVRHRVWRIYSNIRIFEYIGYKYIFGHSFVSIFWYKYIRIFVCVNFLIRIYSDIHSYQKIIRIYSFLLKFSQYIWILIHTVLAICRHSEPFMNSLILGSLFDLTIYNQFNASTLSHFLQIIF